MRSETPKIEFVHYQTSATTSTYMRSITHYNYGNLPYALYIALAMLAFGKLIKTCVDHNADVRDSRQEAIDAVDDALVEGGIMYFEELALNDPLRKEEARYHAERLKERLS